MNDYSNKMYTILNINNLNNFVNTNINDKEKKYSKTFDATLIDKKKYYHYIYVSDFLIDKDFIDKFIGVYKFYLEKLIDDKKKKWTEQVIITYIYRDRPELFYKLTDEYCEVIKYLYDYRNTDILLI